MRSSILLQLILLAWLGTSRTVISQQPPELSALYGRGVHSFFASQVSRAEQQFTQVIDAGSTDPRAYYFRGMARLRMGRMEEARSDMRIGASYEARRPGDRAAISKSLQRVQGSGRLMLERFRREARLVRGEQRRSQSRTRYQRLQRREADVLRQPVDLPLEQLLGGESADVTEPSSSLESAPVKVPPGTSPAAIPRDQDPPIEPALPAGASDPFGEASPAVPSESEPAVSPEPAVPAQPEPAVRAEAEPAGEDPFGQPEAPAGASDPFGEASPAVPSESEPAVSPEPSVPAQPEPAVPAESEPAEEDPFGQPEAPAGASDPFGEASPAVPSESEPAVLPEPSVPAESESAEEDPFGQSEAPADASDPFGETSPSTSPAEVPTTGVAEGDATETPQVDQFGEPAQAASPANEKIPVASSKGDKAAAGSNQVASQKEVESKKKSDKGTKGKSTGKKSPAPKDSAPDDAKESGTDRTEKPAESTNLEDDPFGAEDDPFGGF